MDFSQLATERTGGTGTLTVLATLAFVAACFAAVELLDRRRSGGAAPTGTGTGTFEQVEPAADTAGLTPIGFGRRGRPTVGAAARDAARRPWTIVAAVVGPIAAVAFAAALTPVRGRDDAVAVLALVLVIAAAAAVGHLVAAATTSAAAALAFNFVFSEPYLTFHIARPADAVTGLLMIVVGVALGALSIPRVGSVPSPSERSTP